MTGHFFVMSFAWYVPEDGSELCNFELGHSEDAEWDNGQEDLRRTVLYLVRERTSFIAKLRGMYALREFLHDHDKKFDRCEHDQARFHLEKQETESVSTCACNNASYGNGQNTPRNTFVKAERQEEGTDALSSKGSPNGDLRPVCNPIR